MAQTYDVKLFQRGGVTMVLYPDGDEAVLADVMRYMNPGMEYDQATGEQMATPPPPAESATYSGSTVRDKPFGSIAGGMAEPYMSQAYDALTRTPVVDPNSYVPQYVQRINQAVGGLGGAGLSGLLGLIYGGAGLVGDVANATGLGGGQRLANDLAGMVDVAGVGPEARMVEMLSNAGAGRSIARTVAERANQRGPVPVMGSNFANLLGDTLPAPRNEAEAIAKDILELRATGNVDAVTEGMMNAADPQYMYNYTPLPMDEASRMARAAEMGFETDLYHGTKSSFPSFDEKPIYSSDNPYLSSTYAGSSIDGNIMPLAVRKTQGIPVVNAEGAYWSRLAPSMQENINVPFMGGIGETPYDLVKNGEILRTTKDFLKTSREQGYGGVTFNDITDRGPWSAFPKAKKGTAEYDDFIIAQQRANLPSRVEARLNPADIRSRFARFDPMFANLRNLSAGVAISPLAYGLLSDQYARENRQ